MLLLLLNSTVHARPDKSWKTIFGHISLGAGLPQGDASEVAEDGFTFGGGVSYWPEVWPLGLQFDLGYNKFDIEKAFVNAADASDGDIEMLSLTSAGVWSPFEGRFGLDLIAGVGVYRIEGELTDPGFYLGTVCDPWLWWCYTGILEGDVVVAKESTTEFGYNAGLSLTFELMSGSQFFLESRYHWIDTDVGTEYVPISIGFRW
jgi:hypothetical protein